MLKVKINNEWIEDVASVEKVGLVDQEYKISNSSGGVGYGKIQDIKWVEDEPDEIEELDRDNVEDYLGEQLLIKLNEVIKSVNKLLKENKQ